MIPVEAVVHIYFFVFSIIILACGNFKHFLRHCCTLFIFIFPLFQALILRDYWLITVISVLFEVLEYSLEHQLPNFSECWWDHVSLLYVLCNTY